MIANNLEKLISELPSQVQLVAVSKTKPISLIQEAYDFGHRHFGENKTTELSEKFDALPKDINWHFIGHLQTNKVKHIIGKTFLIHSMDRVSLFEELNKQAKKMGIAVDVLLQFHIAQEESKHGFSFDEALEFLKSSNFINSINVNVVGVMGMATFTNDENQIRGEFDNLMKYFNELKSTIFITKENFKTISMGMSGDYKIAIEAGSNMIRVGSSIFGER